MHFIAAQRNNCSRVIKFMLDYEHVVIDNLRAFGGPNYRGARIDWIAARSVGFCCM